MENIEFIASGYNGQVELYSNKICIRRKGIMAFLSHGFKGDKTIMLSTISSIQFKKANLLSNGYIQFTFTGSQEAKGGLTESVSDENSVMFLSGEQQSSFEKLRDAIEEHIQSRNAPVATVSCADEIAKFAKLRDEGIITEEEFIQKKKQFLNL